MKELLAKDSENLIVFDENMKKGIPPTIIKLILSCWLVSFTVFCFMVPVAYKFWDWMDSWPWTPLLFCLPAAYILGKKLWSRIFKVRG